MRRLLLLALFIRLLFIFGNYHPDLGNHVDWGNKFWEYGPKKFYEGQFWNVSWPNQPPGTIYLWAGIAKINEGAQSAIWWLNNNFSAFPSGLVWFFQSKLHPALVKLPPIFAEIGIGWLIYRIILQIAGGPPARDRTRRLGIAAAALFLFNPITIYNSAVWGQTDGIINFFALASIYSLLNRKLFSGIFFFVLSLYIKASLIIFAPVILVLLLYRIVATQTIPDRLRLVGRIMGFVAISFLVICLFSLPMVNHNNVFKWLGDLYQTRIFGHQGNMLTGNAFNIWALIFGIDFSRRDEAIFLFFSLRQWGRLLFGLTLIPIVVALIRRKFNPLDYVWSFMLVSFSAFLFLTNMHERYLYPVFPLLAILAVLNRRVLAIYVVVSIIHFINLYNLWFYPGWIPLRNILEWNGGVIVRPFSLLLIIIYAYLLVAFIKRPISAKIIDNASSKD